MMSQRSMPYSITVPTSNRRAPSSVVARQWLMQWRSGSGRQHFDWSSAEREPHYGKPLRWG
jgi:hypothetical protein